jgi:hypothetical protein
VQLTEEPWSRRARGSRASHSPTDGQESWGGLRPRAAKEELGACLPEQSYHAVLAVNDARADALAAEDGGP